MQVLVFSGYSAAQTAAFVAGWQEAAPGCELTVRPYFDPTLPPGSGEVPEGVGAVIDSRDYLETSPDSNSAPLGAALRAYLLANSAPAMLALGLTTVHDLGWGFLQAITGAASPSGTTNFTPDSYLAAWREARTALDWGRLRVVCTTPAALTGFDGATRRWGQAHNRLEVAQDLETQAGQIARAQDARQLLNAGSSATAPASGAGGGVAWACAQMGASLVPVGTQVVTPANLDLSAQADLIIFLGGALADMPIEFVPAAAFATAAGQRTIAPSVAVVEASQVPRRALPELGLHALYLRKGELSQLSVAGRRLAQTWRL